MSKARDLARLSPNTSGELPSANIANAAVTKAKQAADAYTVVKVRQYVHNGSSAVNYIANNNWTDLGIYGDITPTYSNSIIKVEFVMPLSFSNQMNCALRIARRIGGGSFSMPSTTTPTAISNRLQGHMMSLWGFGDNWSNNNNFVVTFLDNPGTTSQCTYRAEIMSSSNFGIRVGFNYDQSSGGNDFACAPQIVILTELAAGVVETVDAI